MIISDRNKLESWLDQNNWFEDGFISKIEQDSNGLIITVGFQIKGTYVAGEPMTIKEFDLKPKRIKNWTFADSGFRPSYDWCIERLDLIENDFGIRFETQNVFNLTCDSIDISEPREFETLTKPWLSEREIFISATVDSIPKPDFWINLYKQYFKNIGFRVHGDLIKETNKIPYPDYSGFFIQRPDRINENDKGILIKSIAQNGKYLNISFELYDTELKTEWNVLYRIISNFDGLKVNCGNVSFNQNEWLDFIATEKLPRDLEKIKNVC
jgi:hypothetical protein